MIRFNAARAVVLLGLLAVTAGQSRATTVLVDTIGNGSQYQVGREVSRTVQLGFDSYPASGDFTGVRPTYTSKAPTFGSVTELGTTGVPCSQLWQAGAPGFVSPISGIYAAWVIQPFTAAASGYVTSVQFIAQIRQTAAYYQGTGRTAYVDIIPAQSGTQLPATLWQSAQPVAVDISTAYKGTIVTANGINKQLSAGGQYWLVLAPVNTLGIWNQNGLDYANLNWGNSSTVPDKTRVTSALYSNNNGSGNFLPLTGRIIGIKVSGLDQAPTSASTGSAKKLADGTVVLLNGVVINGKLGAVGPDYFYVEDPLRPSGIRVVGTTSYNEGDVVNVMGTVTTLANGEKAVTPDSVNSAGSPAPVDPVFVTLKGLKSGLGMTGMLVKLAGKVQSVSGATFVLDDGSDALGITCKGVSGWATLPTAGQIGEVHTVAGVVSKDTSGNLVVLSRNASDIQ